MKKQLLMIFVLFLVIGCSPQKDKEEQLSNEEVFGEEYEVGGTIGIKNYKLVDNLIELEVLYEKKPIDREHIVFVAQDNQLVPFSFEKDGNFDYSQRFKMKGEKLENNKLYVNPTEIEEGKSYNFYVVFIDNPDYMPEPAENVVFESKQQALSCGVREIVVDGETHIKEANEKEEAKGKWEKTVSSNNQFNQNSILDGESKETLKGLLNGSINQIASPVIKLNKGDHLKWNISVKSDSFKNAGAYFFLDSQLLKLKNGFDYLELNYHDGDFGITEAEVVLPDNIQKGYHSFYMLVFDQGSNMNQMTDFYSRRMILVE